MNMTMYGVTPKDIIEVWRRPGQKGTVTLTITPNAPKGTVVHGFIGVDTLNLATASGDDLVNIPYTYKVG